jgi:hypothetical protein
MIAMFPIYPPRVSVPVLVNSLKLKGVSSRLIRKRNDPSIRREAAISDAFRLSPARRASR